MSDRHPEGVRSPEIDKRGPIVAVLLLIVVSIILFPLRRMLAVSVVRAVAYVVWVLNITGRIIPQQVLWICLLVVILYIAVGSFYGKRLEDRPSPERRSPLIGRVQTITRWIEEGGRGTYFRWRIASLLGKIHQTNQIFASRGDSSQVPLPSPQVQDYLNAGVNTSYVDYERPGWFQSGAPTPLDIPLEQVVEYLEKQMEIKNGQ